MKKIKANTSVVIVGLTLWTMYLHYVQDQPNLLVLLCAAVLFTTAWPHLLFQVLYPGPHAGWINPHLLCWLRINEGSVYIKKRQWHTTQIETQTNIHTYMGVHACRQFVWRSKQVTCQIHFTVSGRSGNFCPQTHTPTTLKEKPGEGGHTLPLHQHPPVHPPHPIMLSPSKKTLCCHHSKL